MDDSDLTRSEAEELGRMIRSSAFQRYLVGKKIFFEEALEFWGFDPQTDVVPLTARIRETTDLIERRALKTSMWHRPVHQGVLTLQTCRELA